MHFFVGSSNPVKINAVKFAVAKKFPNAVVIGFDVQSGVRHQPMTDDETRRGAENRAYAAISRGLEEYPEVTDAVGIGLEGGVFEADHELWSTVWAAVSDHRPKSTFVFTANGGRVLLPQEISKPMLAGEEMGPVIQRLSGILDVRQKQGMFGVVTKGFVERTEEYSSIVKLAIGLWYGKDWQHHD